MTLWYSSMNPIFQLFFQKFNFFIIKITNYIILKYFTINNKIREKRRCPHYGWPKTLLYFTPVPGMIPYKCQLMNELV